MAVPRSLRRAVAPGALPHREVAVRQAVSVHVLPRDAHVPRSRLASAHWGTSLAGPAVATRTYARPPLLSVRRPTYRGVARGLPVAESRCANGSSRRRG